MPFNSISSHAPTGYAHTKISSNPYDQLYGRNVPYPGKFSVYVNKISEADGSQSISEVRTRQEIIGNRLYLWHRPLVNPNGTATTISVSDGTIDTSLTNSRQAYIVFTVLPAGEFTVTYTASPDCLSAWHINVLQDDIMEIQKTLGPNNLTGYAGLRNLQYGIFDSPNDAVTVNTATRAVYLSDLNKDITIASSTDAGIIATYGAAHTIQLGRATDQLIVDVTGFTVTQSDPTKVSRITLGTKTGDLLYYKGQISGEGPITIGGPSWPGYSGVFFTTGLTGSFYNNSMLRVNGDVAVIGAIKSHGPITVTTVTGESSIVLGDWTVSDELTVGGTTRLNGQTFTNRLEVNNNLYVDGNVILNNQSQSNGQSLVDNLDPSEVAHSYKAITKKRLSYSVVDGKIYEGELLPNRSVYSSHYSLGPSSLAEEVFSITGSVNAPSGPSGEHPNIIQLNINLPIVTGTFGSTGRADGVWSPGLMEPGNLWIKIISGQARGFVAPIYGYTIEQISTGYIQKLNVFCPELIEPRPTTFDHAIIYNPYNILYDYIGAAGGASPTFNVKANSEYPLIVSFDDEVRILKNDTTNISLLPALVYSVSGQVGSIQSGNAFIFASKSGTDPESAPIFKARPVPFRMPHEVVIGEVVATYNTAGSTWTILDTISYKPNGIYDSCWIPVVSGISQASHQGRFIPQLSTTSDPVKVYFQHNLGPDVDLSMTNIDLYLGVLSTSGKITELNKTHSAVHSFFGSDVRAGFNNGSVLRIPVGGGRTASLGTERDASMFYLDGKVIGLQLTPDLLDAIPTGSGTAGGSSYNYMRLVMRRDV